MYRLHFALLEFRTFFVGFVLTFLFVVFGRFLYYFWGVDDSFHSVRGCLMILIFRVKAFVDNLWRDTIIFLQIGSELMARSVSQSSFSA